MNNTVKSGEFRRWVHEQWLLNRDELEALHQSPRTQQEYWQLYSHWLRAKFRQQQRINQ